MSVHDEGYYRNASCALNLISRFYFARPSFCHVDGTHLSKYYINVVLKKSLSYLHVPVWGYKNHSFRIGMVTTLIKDGRSDEEIKCMGRRKSHAFEDCIRTY